MIFESKSEFLDNIFKSNIACLDVSKNNIGLAVCNLETEVVTPVKTLRRQKFADDINLLKNFFAEYNIGGLVLGLPLNMDGSDGPTTQSIRQFARNVLKEFDLPLIFQDERLTTVASKEAMFEAGAKANKVEKNNDSMAATIILQDFLKAS